MDDPEVLLGLRTIGVLSIKSSWRHLRLGYTNRIGLTTCNRLRMYMHTLEASFLDIEMERTTTVVLLLTQWCGFTLLNDRQSIHLTEFLPRVMAPVASMKSSFTMPRPFTLTLFDVTLSWLTKLIGLGNRIDDLVSSDSLCSPFLPRW